MLRARASDTDLLRCLQVDDKLKLGRLLHRQVEPAGAFQDLVNVVGGRAAITGRYHVRPIGHQHRRHGQTPSQSK